MENGSSAVCLEEEQQQQCRSVHSSAPADVVTINHLAEMKYKEVTLTAHGHTEVSCLENNQKSDWKCSEIQNQWSQEK